MNRLFRIMVVVALGVIAVGCYNDYSAPAPEKIYTDADFLAKGLKYKSIKELKEDFYKANPSMTEGTAASYLVTEPIYTRGKVISSDYYGNVYKSVYIYDETTERAIEIRLNTGNYLFYPVGRLVFVELQGLVLGNYRGMVSIGTQSSDPEYANANITGDVMTSRHIKRGAQIGMTKADTLVIKSTDYTTKISDDARGRLVRFEGLTSKYGTQTWGYKNTFPNYFANKASYDVKNPNPFWKNFIDNGATWALSIPNPDAAPGTNAETIYYYGSAWFTYGDLTVAGDYAPGNYVVRTSGYSTFRDAKIPVDGSVVDITAIYTKYTGPVGQNKTYQLVLNAVSDVRQYMPQ